ncbi:MAG: hypothetical protein HKN45_11930 [Flavobacteriales bacterium]|nr:hypothetical protein [Flavobacteriales bacterium]
MSEEVKEISNRSSYLETEERFSLIIIGRLKGKVPNLRVIWAIAWVIIGIAVTSEAKRLGVNADARMVLFVFMAFWAYYLFRIVRAIRWNQVGKEMLMMKEESLYHKNSFGDFGRTREYHLANVNPLKLREKKDGWASLFEDSFWSIGIGALELEIDGKILSIGIRLDDTEAKKVMSVFNNELKRRQKAL